MTIINYAELVKFKWGDGYYQPDTVYRWSNGETRKDSGQSGGIYNISTTTTVVGRSMNAGNVGAAQEGYVLTGVAVDTRKGRTIDAAVGSFTQTGVDSIIVVGPYIVPALGTYALTGVDVTFTTKLWGVVGDLGSYSMTGVDVTLTKTGVSAGSLTATMGSFTFAGNDIILTQ